MLESGLNAVLCETVGAHPVTEHHFTVDELFERQEPTDRLLLIIVEVWAEARENVTKTAAKLAESAAKVAETGQYRAIAISHHHEDFTQAVGALEALRSPMSAAVNAFKQANGWPKKN